MGSHAMVYTMRSPIALHMLRFCIGLGVAPACSDESAASEPIVSADGGVRAPVTDASTVGEADAQATGSVEAGAAQGVTPTFVAVGYEGRSIVSCDDGQSWMGDRSDDDTVRCFSPTDCDHDGKAGRGLAFGNGWFVANYGWGAPGTIRRSRDGLRWENVLNGSNFASMMFGKGTFVGAAGTGKLSMDGKAWSDAASTGLNTNVRRGGFVETGFLVVADGPAAAFSPTGQTWSVRTLPASCGADIQWEGGIASGNGVMVVLGGNGNACSSTNEGLSWTTSALGVRVDARLLFTGTEFVTWGDGKMFRSTNGQSWTSVPLVQRIAGSIAPGAPSLGPIARSPSGTYVAINGGWQQWYDKQRFYRSTDGVTWDELDGNRYVKGHPMTSIVWGAATTSACKK